MHNFLHLVVLTTFLMSCNDLQLAVAQLLQAPSFDSQLHYNKKRIVGNIISGNAYKGYDIALIQQTQF